MIEKLASPRNIITAQDYLEAWVIKFARSLDLPGQKIHANGLLRSADGKAHEVDLISQGIDKATQSLVVEIKSLLHSDGMSAGPARKQLSDRYFEYAKDYKTRPAKGLLLILETRNLFDDNRLMGEAKFHDQPSGGKGVELFSRILRDPTILDRMANVPGLTSFSSKRCFQLVFDARELPSKIGDETLVIPSDALDATKHPNGFEHNNRRRSPEGEIVFSTRRSPPEIGVLTIPTSSDSVKKN